MNGSEWWIWYFWRPGWLIIKKESKKAYKIKKKKKENKWKWIKWSDISNPLIK